MVSIFDIMNDDYLSESSYEKMATLDTCYESLNEGITDRFVVNITSSYTHSIIFEVLDNVKETLIKLYQRVLSSLNNYILNSANLADKYRNLIIERYGKLQSPIMFQTYQYPKLKDKDYPSLVKSSTTLEREIEELQNEVIKRQLTPGQTGELVDKMLKSFSKSVLGESVDPYNIKDTATKIVESNVRGREVIRKLEKSELSVFIDELKQYKVMKDDINRTKTNMLKDYEMLKHVYTNSMKNKEAESKGLKDLKDPDVVALEAADYQRFANINLNMTRMFNGFITIYSTAFDTKLSILQDKINANRNIIVELMTQTGIFAALNTKNPSKTKKPMIFDPALEM